MSVTRRQLLAGGLSLGGAAALGLSLGLPFRARAEEGTTPTVRDRYFVFVYFFGGWDVMLSLDPKDPGEFNDARLSQTGIQPAYDQLVDDELPSEPMVETGVPGMVFGPYIGDMARHADKLAVCRGMAMDSVAHLVGQRHANTGRVPAGTSVRGSSLSTYFAALLADGEPIPNLSGDIESFNLTHPLWATGITVQNIGDLQEALAPAASELGAAERDALDRFFDNERTRTRRSWERLAIDNRRTGRQLIERDLAELFDLRSGTAEMLALRDRFGIDSGATGDSGGRALMAAQALTRGVSRVVTFKASGAMDAHDGNTWNSVHGPRQREGFNAIAALVDHLSETPYGDGTSWLDHTTIVVQSEFSRTPALNSRGGRDHHITNSAMVLGAGIRGGTIIGASSDYKNGALAVDPLTGKVDPGGMFVHNHHLARTLFQSIGVTADVADLRVEHVPALLA